MPLYNVACKTPLSDQTRARVTKAITDVHCTVTDAPAVFVNVLFMDNHPLKDGNALHVIGAVRSGGNRNAALIDRLRDEMHAGVAEAAATDAGQVAVELIGIKPQWVMEGGKILPDPGAEDEWLEDAS